MSARLACALLWLLGGSACDVGRPVVDSLIIKGGLAECFALPPECDKPLPSTGVNPAISNLVDLPACDLGEGGLTDVTLRGCELELPSDDDALTLENANLQDVLLVARDAKMLQIVTSTLSRVKVRGSGEDAAFEGAIVVTHSKLSNVDARSERLELVSTRVFASLIHADGLLALDVNFESTVLEASNLELSAVRLRSSHVRSCDRLLLASGGVTAARFDACSEIARIYDTELDDATLDGPIESDGSTFARCRFGLNDPTWLTAWNTSLDQNFLCEHTLSLRMSGGSVVCTGCEGPLDEDEGELCGDELRLPHLDKNACLALEAEPLSCSPFPERPRPLTENGG